MTEIVPTYLSRRSLGEGGSALIGASPGASVSVNIVMDEARQREEGVAPKFAKG